MNTNRNIPRQPNKILDLLVDICEKRYNCSVQFQEILVEDSGLYCRANGERWIVLGIEDGSTYDHIYVLLHEIGHLITYHTICPTFEHIRRLNAYFMRPKNEYLANKTAIRIARILGLDVDKMVQTLLPLFQSYRHNNPCAFDHYADLIVSRLSNSNTKTPHKLIQKAA